MTKRSVPYIHTLKVSEKKIIALTAYDYTMAKIIDTTNKVDLILVGDSLASTIKGEKNTLSVTLKEMIYHTKCVCRGVENAIVVADMPFMSYQVSKEDALRSAGKILKETNCNAVKLEGGVNVRDKIEALVAVDIPVLGHIGLTPQSYHRMGGHKLQGKEQSYQNNLAGSEAQIVKDAIAVEKAGAFAIVLEGMPAKLAKKISLKLKIPTIGIACGEEVCDGKILVINDLLGFSADKIPSFVNPLLNLKKNIEEAVISYSESV